jgi:hypothetical protein
MDKEQLIAVARKSASNLVALVIKNADELLEVADKAEEIMESPEIKINHTMTLVLKDHGMKDRISWNVIRKDGMDCPMPDPNQPELWEDDNEPGL